MTLEQQIALMREQAASKALPEYIRQSLQQQIAVLEQGHNVAAPAAVAEKEHIPFSIKRKKKEA